MSCFVYLSNASKANHLFRRQRVFLASIFHDYNRPLAKVKNSPPSVPPYKGGKQEKLGSLPLVRGGLGRGLSIFARGLIFQDYRR
jgi:hypothetical protein